MNCKREVLIYLIVFLWIFMGFLGINHETNLTELATYFVSLTGFVSAYIWGETTRKSKSTNFWKKGTNSKRQVMMYATVVLWAALGIFGILKGSPIMQFSAYFAALTPFVGGWMIGETIKKI